MTTQTSFDERCKKRGCGNVCEDRASASAQNCVARNANNGLFGKTKAFVGTITECDTAGKGRLVYCATDGARYLLRFLRSSVVFKVGDLVWFDVKNQAENEMTNPLAMNVTRYVCSDYYVES